MRVDDAAARLEALGNPTRLKIFRILVRAGRQGLPVGNVQGRLGLAPSTLSHHLKALVTVGLVKQLRESTTLRCHVNYECMRSLVEFLASECCVEASNDCSVVRQGAIDFPDREEGTWRRW